MRIEVYYAEPLKFLLNEPDVSGFYRRAYDRPTDVRENDDLAACEEVWMLLGNNFEANKPTRFKDRTMSVGDLVRFDGDDERVYQAMSIGFAKVEDAAHLDLDGRATMDFPTYHELDEDEGPVVFIDGERVSPKRRP